ncbi:MAG: hypothetical protein HPY51_17210 [Candidatus Omnitrophica bacterium]|nr:hypothetical protein [Candidatus Omnitrophota bacterium]
MKRHLVRMLVLGMWAAAAMEAAGQIHIGGIMRDEYALGLTPTIKSAGMGGAYVGVDDVRSMNPAALGNVKQMEGTLGYRYYDHDQGPAAHRGRMDLVLPFPVPDMVPILGNSAFRLMLDGVLSEDAASTALPGSPEVEFDAVTLGLQYGISPIEWASLGVGAYPYEKAHVDLITPAGTLEGEALSQIGSMQIGALFRPSPYFTIGGQFIYIKDDLEVTMPNGVKMGDYFHIHYFAIGAAVMPWEGTLIAADYWNGEMEGAVDPTTPFDQDVDRWNVGAEQQLGVFFEIPVDIRAGYSNGGFTAGFTYHFNENIELDYAYINEALADKDEIFGKTDFHGVSITARF